MTEPTPPPPSDDADTPAETTPAESQSTGASTPSDDGEQPPTGTRSRRTIVVGVALGALVVVLAGGAFAWQKLSGGGPQPQDVLPSDVVAFARVDADPSASQKIALLRLIRRVPDAAKQIGITSPSQDVRMLALANTLNGCGLDYTTDVKPWLGNRIGVGVRKDGTLLVAVQVSDQKKAEPHLLDVTDCLGLKGGGYTFHDGYAVVASSTSEAERAVRSTEKRSLAKRPAFVEDMASLGNEGVASAWLDVSSAESVDGGFGAGLVQGLGGADSPTLKAMRSTAVALRAGSSTLEIASISHAVKDFGYHKPAGIDQLPASSAVALAYSGGAGDVDSEWTAAIDSLTQQGLDPTPFLDQLTRETGLTLPQDLTTLLGKRVTLTVGSKNLHLLGGIDSPSQLSLLDVALGMHSTSADAVDLATRLKAAARKELNLQLTTHPTSDGAMLGTTTSAARDVDPDKTLGDDADFSTVVPHASHVYGAAYVDVAAIVRELDKEQGKTADVQDTLTQLRHVAAVGVSTDQAGDRVSRTTLRVELK